MHVTLCEILTMNKYLVTFDLDSSVDRTQEYKEVEKYLKTFSKCAKPLKNTYLIETNTSTSEIRDKLRTIFIGRVHILVVQLLGKYSSLNVASANIELSNFIKQL